MCDRRRGAAPKRVCPAREPLSTSIRTPSAPQSPVLFSSFQREIARPSSTSLFAPFSRCSLLLRCSSNSFASSARLSNSHHPPNKHINSSKNWHSQTHPDPQILYLPRNGRLDPFGRQHFSDLLDEFELLFGSEGRNDCSEDRSDGDVRLADEGGVVAVRLTKD